MAISEKTPLVTVITATYNSSTTLRMTLSSLLAQDFTDFEALVIGDGCTDDSGAVVAEFGDPRLIWTNLPTNSGSQSVPNNEGLRRARGKYIAYLGHDDLWFPWHLSGLVRAMETGEADLVHGLCMLLVPDGMAPPLGPPPRGKSYRDILIPPSCAMHRRAVVDEVGFWHDPRTLTRPIDQDYFLRIFERRERITYVPQATTLKFPSGSWNLYKRTGDFPQTSYLAAMQRDPQQLARDVLMELATGWARFEREVGPSPHYIYIPPGTSLFKIWRHAFHHLISRSVDRVLAMYGRERWPIPALKAWGDVRRYQAERQAKRRERGLDPDV